MTGVINMSIDNNDKKPEKLTDEELKAILEELKSRKRNKDIPLTLGFLLHRNYLAHILLSFGLNYLLSAVVIGLASGIKQPLMEITIIGFLLGITLLTLIENFVKILLFKYALRIMIFSIGLLSVFVQIIILYVIDLLLGPSFSFYAVEHIFVFAFLFSIFRVTISSYIRKRIYQERLIIFGGIKK